MLNLLIKIIFFYFTLITVVLGGSVAFSISGVPYLEGNFYSVFPKTEWDKADNKQRGDILNKFINRIVVFEKADQEGFLEQPYIAIRLRNRTNQLLVNATYDFLVAAPLVEEGDLLFTQQNLKREIKVKHLLVSYSGSRLPFPLTKNKGEAKRLSFELYNRIAGGASFVDLSLQYSDDPSVKKNNGDLGWLSWGQTVQVFQRAAFSLGVGGVSVPVLTDFGYHIIYLEEERKSQYAHLDSLGYMASCQEFAIKGVPLEEKRRSAEVYDRSILSHSGVVFNVPSILKIVTAINTANNKNKIVSGGKKNVLALLNEMQDIGVVCVYNGDGYGLRWFASHLSGFPASRLPSFQNVDEIISIFRSAILQKSALTNSSSLVNDFGFVLTPKLLDLRKNIVYDSYIKYLINNLEKPNKDTIRGYYEKNKEEKYTEHNLVEVREIKVLARSLADSLFLLLGGGWSFVGLAENHSLTNPSGGGIIAPFAEKKYGPMGVVAHSLGVGTYSTPTENLDGSWSLVYLLRRIEKQYIPMERVYNKIESLLAKENQSNFKIDFLSRLFVEFNVMVSPTFYVSEE